MRLLVQVLGHDSVERECSPWPPGASLLTLSRGGESRLLEAARKGEAARPPAWPSFSLRGSCSGQRGVCACLFRGASYSPVTAPTDRRTDRPTDRGGPGPAGPMGPGLTRNVCFLSSPPVGLCWFLILTTTAIPSHAVPRPQAPSCSVSYPQAALAVPETRPRTGREGDNGTLGSRERGRRLSSSARVSTRPVSFHKISPCPGLRRSGAPWKDGTL